MLEDSAVVRRDRELIIFRPYFSRHTLQKAYSHSSNISFSAIYSFSIVQEFLLSTSIASNQSRALQYAFCLFPYFTLIDLQRKRFNPVHITLAMQQVSCSLSTVLSRIIFTHFIRSAFILPIFTRVFVTNCIPHCYYLNGSLFLFKY